MDSVVNKPGGTARVTVIGREPDSVRYHLLSDAGQAWVLDLPKEVADVELGDVFDWEGTDFTAPTRVSFGGEVLFEAPVVA